MLEQLLDEAAEAGGVRPGLRHRHVAGIVLQAIMFNAFASTITGSPQRLEGVDPAEDLWDLIGSGIVRG